jgi:hypothetical protein
MSSGNLDILGRVYDFQWIAVTVKTLLALQRKIEITF